MTYHFKYEKATFHQELHSFEIIIFYLRNILVHLQLCHNNETMHFNQIYEELRSLEPKKTWEKRLKRGFWQPKIAFDTHHYECLTPETKLSGVPSTQSQRALCSDCFPCVLHHVVVGLGSSNKLKMISLFWKALTWHSMVWSFESSETILL